LPELDLSKIDLSDIDLSKMDDSNIIFVIHKYVIALRH
jgi:hypothetical protein